MRDNIWKYILVISLLMNFSFLGAAAYSSYTRSHTARPFAGPAVLQGHPGPSDSNMPTGHLFNELSLKPEQIELFQQKAAVFHQALLKKREEVDPLRASLVALMRADTRDDRAIEETIGRINERQEEMQKMVVSHMLEFKSMLDKDQQQKFLDLIANAMGQPGEEVCPWQEPNAVKGRSVK